MSIHRAGAIRRGRAAALVAVVAGAVLAGRPGLPQGKEREFPTIVALGGLQPVQSEEGLFTPLVVLDHESAGHYGEGTLRVEVRTATARAGLTHPLGPHFAWGYAARLRATNEGDGTALYRAGERLSGNTFQGDSLALILAGHYLPAEAIRLTVEAERQWSRFRSSDTTRPGFTLPSDFTQNEARFRLARSGLLGEEEGELSLTLAAGHREQWSDWSLERDAAARADYRKEMARWTQPVDWGEGRRSKVVATLLDGARLDLFNSYAVGGLGGDYPVGGYYRNEFRARRAAVLNLTHELALAEDRILSFHADGAWLRELPLEQEGARPRTLASIGIGYYHGLRDLGGLPIILRYSEGLLIPRGSPELYRREVMVAVAAGF